MNDDLELELRAALRRDSPRAGFTSRVLDRLPSHNPPSPWWRLAVAAVLVCALVLGGTAYRRQQREMAARRTEQQVVFALRLAAAKLARVNYHLQQAGPELSVEKKRGNDYDE